MKQVTIEIALCDDQPEMTDRLEPFLQLFFKERAKEYHFHYFKTPTEVFSYLKHDQIHILLMDLKFDTEDEDGMLWTSKIKMNFPQVLVLILTGYGQRCKEGYKAGAFRFMTKPLSKQELWENMSDCLKEIQGEREVWVKNKGLKFLLPVRDIFFIEAYAGESRVYGRDHVFGSDQTLSAWEKELCGEFFFRINKSYLISLGQVEELSSRNHEVLLSGGKRFRVSRRRWIDFRDMYLQYVSQNADSLNDKKK